MSWDVHGGHPTFATAELERDGWTVTLELAYDEYAQLGQDDDMYGSVVEADTCPEDGAVDLAKLRGCYESQRQYNGRAWYVPSRHWDLADRVESNRGQGMSRSVALDEARESIRAEAQGILADDSGVYTVTARATRADGASSVESCGGIDLWQDDPTESPHVWEVAEDLLVLPARAGGPRGLTDHGAGAARWTGRTLRLGPGRVTAT